MHSRSGELAVKHVCCYQPAYRMDRMRSAKEARGMADICKDAQ